MSSGLSWRATTSTSSGGALDDYQSAQADTRWGVDNPYWPLANEVRSAARDLLRQRPSGRSHASALTVMWHLAEQEDADLIADALEGAPDAEMREMALLVAGTALAEGEEPNRRLLALITAMVLDEGLDVQDRKDAMRALDDLDLPEVEDLIVRLSLDPPTWSGSDLLAGSGSVSWRLWGLGSL